MKSRALPLAVAVGALVGVPAIATYADAPTTSLPHRVVGHGTPVSCTASAFRRAVARGGVITFDCGPDPVTIHLDKTAAVHNDAARSVVIDGGGLVTLSGDGKRRILYQDTCDPALGITSSHCQDQATPKLVLEHLTLTDGNASGQLEEGGGGGAVLVRGGQLRVDDVTFTHNRCDRTGPDLGGAAIRALSQFHGRPVVITHSSFTGGRCSNGGALSSIGVSWRISDSTFSRNSAIGRGANPARPGTPGGGSGGAIYTDGDTYDVHLDHVTIDHCVAREGGGAIFFVSNDRTGSLSISHSALTDNPSRGFETAGYPGIFFLGLRHPRVHDSTIRMTSRPRLDFRGFQGLWRSW